MSKQVYLRKLPSGKLQRGFYNYIRIWNPLFAGKAAPPKWENLNKRRQGKLANPFKGKFVPKQADKFNAKKLRAKKRAEKKQKNVKRLVKLFEAKPKRAKSVKIKPDYEALTRANKRRAYKRKTNAAALKRAEQRRKQNEKKDR